MTSPAPQPYLYGTLFFEMQGKSRYHWMGAESTKEYLYPKQEPTPENLGIRRPVPTFNSPSSHSP